MLFSSRKPLYFVFHDRSERYFQDSTLQLTFSEWLWLTLRKRGYSNIYFVDLDDTGRPVLTLRDRDTWREYTPGGIFSVMEEYRGRPLRRVMGDKEFLRLWNRIYDGPGDCAYVFSAQAFSRLASVRRPKDMDGLLDRMARQERPDALILTGPMDMEASDLDAYLNPHGILAYLSPTGRSLCQAAADLLQREQDVCFFEKLKERLGDQFIELGRPTYGRLLSMLRCVRFALGESWDEDTLEFYALLLLRWVHMRTVKSYCKGLFSDLPKPVTCAGMYALLCRDRAEKLRECTAMLRRTAPDTLSSAQMLEKKFGPLPQEVLDQCWISVREPSLDKLLSFQLPHISSQTEDPVFQICPVDPGDWYLMRRRLRSPRLCPPPKERIGWIDRFLDVLNTAGAHGDSRTVRRTVRVLLRCGRRLYAPGKDTNFEALGAYLASSREYFEMERKQAGLPPEKLEDCRRLLREQDRLFWSVADTDPLDLQSAVERAKEQGHNKADALLKGFSYFT